MADFPDSSFDQLSLRAKLRVDAVLQRFEVAWRHGRPRLEEFLSDAGEDDLPVLLAELLHLDVEYRHRAGEVPRLDDYLARFPGQQALLRLVFPATLKTETEGDNDPARNTASPGNLIARLPPEVPGYEMLGELGRGGMGVVYKARHIALNRLVALKFILAGSNAPVRHLTRFRREAEVVARLRHPNIVQIYDIGEVEGQVFLALEYADGGSVRDRLAGTPIEPRKAAELLEPLARAVQHAHRLGIIHRDLKPANILLSVVGDSVAYGTPPLPDYRTLEYQLPDAPEQPAPLAACVPKLTDFGLARMLDARGPVSEPGMAAGTPQYMAPEQAAGESNIGPSIDVWAMGATLYELLTGRPPFRAATARETLRLILEADPVPPTQLQPSVPRDLETICLKCLEKDPARRYPGARELAEDLKRFVDGEAIHARPDSRLNHLMRWARRRPFRAALAALLCSALLTGAVLITGGALHAARGWRESSIREKEAMSSWQEEQERADQAVEGRSRAEKARRQAEEQAALLLLRQAQDYGSRGDPDRAVHDLLAGLRLVNGQEPLERVFRANLAGWLSQVHALEEIVTVGSEVHFLAQAKGGKLVTAGREGSVRWFDRDGKTIGPDWKMKSPIRFLSLADDGQRVLIGAGAQAVLRDLGGRESAAMTLDHPRLLDGILTPDGKTAFTSGEDGIVRRWDLGDMPIASELQHPSPAQRLALAPDGKSLAVAPRDKPEVWLWDLAASPPTRRVLPQPRPVTALAFHPDGTRFWTGDRSGLVRMLDARAGSEVGLPIHTAAEVKHLGLTPDGMRLLTVTAAGRARLWDVASRHPVGSFRGTTARLGADGAQLLVTHSGEVRIHSLARPLSRLPGEARPEGRAAVASVATLADDNKVLTKLLLGEVVTPRAHGLAWPRDVKAGQALPAPWRHRLPTVPCVALAPNAKVAATVSRQGKTSEVQAWHAETGKILFGPIVVPASVAALIFSPDGQELATGDDTGTVRFWEADKGKEIRSAKVVGEVRVFAYSPEGRTLAVGMASGEQGVVHYLDPQSGQIAGPLLRHDAPVSSLAFTPDGNRLLVGGPVTTLYDRTTGRAITSPIRDATAWRLARDGTVVLVATASGQIHRFKASDGTALHPPASAPGPIVAVDLSADGTTLLAASGDGSARLWDVGERLALLGPPLVAGGVIVEARFRGDERSVFTLTEDGTIRLWPLPRLLTGPLEQIERRVLVQTGQEVVGGALVPLSSADWRVRRKNLDPDSNLTTDSIAWHDARAHDAYQDGDLFAARWHLDRLLLLQDADRAVYRRRAVVLARLRLGDAAREDHLRAGPKAFVRELEYGLSRCQVAGDLPAARWYVGELLKARPDERWVLDEQAMLGAK